jgi:rhomboid protease GluP
MWGLTNVLDRVFRGRDVTGVITIVCIAVYVLCLLRDPAGALRPQGIFGILSPSNAALFDLGATGALPVQHGRWWTLITAIYLHGGLLHLIFNIMWIRQLGPAVEELFGRARLVIIFTVAGIVGFVVSNALGIPFTVGASGSIFGLLGAMVAFGRRRGGTYGQLVLRQYGQWALVLFVLGFFMSGVNNWAHGGGFVGGLAAGFLLSFESARRESGLDRLLAAGCIVMTVLGFALALWTAFLRSRRTRSRLKSKTRPGQE